MKKGIQMFLVLCMMLLGMQVAFAGGEKATVDKDFELATIHRMVLVEPQYTPLKDGAAKADITNMMFKMGEKARFQLLPYDLVLNNIQRDKNVSFASMDKKEVSKIFEANAAQYADAYMVPTVVHNDRVVIFFDVYAAATNKLVYTYQIVADRTDPDTLATYQELTKQFYRAFDKSVQKQLKDNEKAK